MVTHTKTNWTRNDYERPDHGLKIFIAFSLFDLDLARSWNDYYIIIYIYKTIRHVMKLNINIKDNRGSKLLNLFENVWTILYKDAQASKDYEAACISIVLILPSAVSVAQNSSPKI